MDSGQLQTQPTALLQIVPQMVSFLLSNPALQSQYLVLLTELHHRSLFKLVQWCPVCLGLCDPVDQYLCSDSSVTNTNSTTWVNNLGGNTIITLAGSMPIILSNGELSLNTTAATVYNSTLGPVGVCYNASTYSIQALEIIARVPANVSFSVQLSNSGCNVSTSSYTVSIDYIQNSTQQQPTTSSLFPNHKHHTHQHQLYHLKSLPKFCPLFKLLSCPACTGIELNPYQCSKGPFFGPNFLGGLTTDNGTSVVIKSDGQGSMVVTTSSNTTISVAVVRTSGVCFDALQANVNALRIVASASVGTSFSVSVKSLEPTCMNVTNVATIPLNLTNIQMRQLHSLTLSNFSPASSNITIGCISVDKVKKFTTVTNTTTSSSTTKSTSTTSVTSSTSSSATASTNSSTSTVKSTSTTTSSISW
ncbi:hypothetical protein HDU76_012451 [Blyttiomyces sp. JEL0837]|nr:hypothetical protein HDU76_012451 [Blyttiomyces sp. JEL0837]